MEEEIWADIKGYEGLYKISNYGNVKSLERYKKNHSKMAKVEEKDMKPYLNNNGYLYVNLNKNGICKHIYIHRLLMEAFVPNPNNYSCINHRDGNKLNNSLTNLEWCSYSYNNKEAYRLGLKKPSKNLIGKKRSEETKRKISKSQKGKKNKGVRKIMRAVNQYSLDGEFLNSYESSREAIRSLGKGTPSCITIACRKEKTTAYGYIWRYAEE